MAKHAQARAVAAAVPSGGKVLLAGTDPLVPLVRETLESQGVATRCAPLERAAETAWLSAPHLVVAVGDAVRDGGKRLRDELLQEPASATIPLLLVGAGHGRPDRGHSHVALISPSLGAHRTSPLVVALAQGLAQDAAADRLGALGTTRSEADLRRPLQQQVSAALHRVERRLALPKRPGSLPPTARGTRRAVSESGSRPVSPAPGRQPSQSEATSPDPATLTSPPDNPEATVTVRPSPTHTTTRPRAERHTRATVKAADSDQFARCAHALLEARNNSDPALEPHAKPGAAATDDETASSDSSVSSVRGHGEPALSAPLGAPQMSAEMRSLIESLDDSDAQATPGEQPQGAQAPSDEPFVLVEFTDDSHHDEDGDGDGDVEPGTFDRVAETAPPIVVDSLPAPAMTEDQVGVVVPPLRGVTGQGVTGQGVTGQGETSHADRHRDPSLLFALDPRDRVESRAPQPPSQTSEHAFDRARLARTFGLAAMAVATVMVLYGLERHNQAARPPSAPQGVNAFVR